MMWVAFWIAVAGAVMLAPAAGGYILCWTRGCRWTGWANESLLQEYRYCRCCLRHEYRTSTFWARVTARATPLDPATLVPVQPRV